MDYNCINLRGYVSVAGEITLLHLSDIHFKRRTGAAVELHDCVRNELNLDVAQIAPEFYGIAGIVVTGDIAFSGAKDEYDHAAEWLKRIASTAGSAPQNVWTIPGNHDVDRSRTSRALQSWREKLRNCPVQDIDTELEALLDDSLVGPVIVAPLERYIEFASRFGCDITAQIPYWQHDLTLNDGSTLTMHGVTSTLISDETDDDGAHRLVMGSRQFLLLRDPGKTYAFLSHHPPQWLRDADQMEDAVCSRANLHLFGHKHRSRVQRINNSVRIVSGAMFPNRREPDWLPRYNFVSVFVQGSGGARELGIRVRPRVWNQASQRFDAEPFEGSDTREYFLSLEPWEQSIAEEIVESIEPETHSIPFEAQSVGRVRVPSPELSGGAQMDPARRLAFRFLSLPLYKRLDIVRRLGLIDEEMMREGHRAFIEAFRRAQAEGRLAELWDAVDEEYPATDRTANPF